MPPLKATVSVEDLQMHTVKTLVRGVLAVSMGIGLAAAGSAAWAAEGHKTSSADQQRYEVRKSSDGTVKYCTKMQAVTGSRLQPVICKTAKEWKHYGVELNVN